MSQCKLEYQGKLFDSEQDIKEFISSQLVQKLSSDSTLSDQLSTFIERWGLHLTTRHGVKGFTPKNGLATKKLAKAMQAQMKKVGGIYDKLSVIYDATHGLILFKDRTGNLLFQKPNLVSSKASDITISKVKDFLKSKGIDYKKIQDASKIGDNNALTDILHRIVMVAEGHESTALPEEAAHVAVEIIEQSNPQLFNLMLNRIAKYNIYNDVLKLYQDDIDYQDISGKPNIRKIKKEAIGKVLAEYVIMSVEGKTENPELIAQAQSWWESIIQWIKSKFSGNPFKEVAEQLINNKIQGTLPDFKSIADRIEAKNMRGIFGYAFNQAYKAKNYTEAVDVVHQQLEDPESYEKMLFEIGNDEQLANDILSSGKYFQKSVPTSQDDIVKSLFEMQKRIAKISTKDDQYYTFDDTRVKNRVTDKSKALNEARFGKRTETEDDRYKAGEGQNGHADIEDIVHRYVDDNGYLRVDPLPQTSVSRLNPDDNTEYEMLEKNIQGRFNTYPAGTRFFSEMMIYDKRTDTAGTIDFIAVKPDGEIDILDWKFMEMDDKKKDIAQWKKDDWSIQMGEYKRILKEVYSVKKFGNTFMVPIRVYHNRIVINNKPQLILDRIKIGAVDYKNEKDIKLVPFAVGEYSTGNEKVDNLIGELNGVVKKIKETKVSETEAFLKKAKIEDYISAIRKLQMQGATEDIVRIVGASINGLLQDVERYEKIIDDPAITPDKIAEIAKIAEENRDIVSIYSTFSTVFNGVLDRKNEEQKELLDKISQISSDASVIIDKFNTILDKGAEKTGAERGISNVSAPEKTLRFWDRTVLSISQAGTKTAQIFYSFIKDAQAKAAFKFQDSVERIEKLENRLKEYASQSSTNIQELTNKYLLKNGDLISRTDPKKLQELKELQKKGNIVEIKKFVTENIDIEAYNKNYEERKEKTFDRIDSGRWAETDTENEKRIKDMKFDFEETFNLKRDAAYVNNNYLRYFFKEQYDSEEYKFIKSTPALFDVYNYLSDLNERAVQLGAIDRKVKNSFFPRVRKTYIERLATGGDKNFLKSLINSIRVNPADEVYGSIDPITHQIKNEIPVAFVDNIPKDERSTDIFKVIALWEKELDQYEWRSELEPVAKLLNDVERRKKSIETGRFNKAVVDENGKPKIIKDNRKNTEYLENFINFYIYGKKLVSKSEDIGYTLNVKKVADQVNSKLGFKILPEFSEEENVTISGTKLIQSANRWFSMKILGLNVVTAASNLAGGKLNAVINSGKYIAKEDLGRNSARMASSLFNTEQGKIYAGLLDYFIPLLDNEEYKKIRNLSTSKAIKYLNSDFLFSLQRGSDKLVSIPIAMSFFDNFMVEDGKLVSIRESVRKKNGWENRSNLPQSERTQLASKIEKEIADLIATKSLPKVTKIIDDKAVIEGIDDRNTKTVWDLRNLIQHYVKDTMGNSTQEDISQYRMSLLGQSFMMFKNWIPRLIYVRFNSLKYNASTESYEYGRLRMLYKAVFDNLGASASNLYNIVKGTDKGIAFIKSLYEKKLDSFLKEGGDIDDFITESEFIDLYQRGIRMALKETLFWIGLMGILWTAGAVTPPEDRDQRAKYNWTLRTIDKIHDELAFFFNPKSMADIANGSVFPALGTFTDLVTLMQKGTLDFAYWVSGNEEGMQKTKTSKYLFKSFPITKELMTYVALFNQDFADDLGIKIQSQYSVR